MEKNVILYTGVEQVNFFYNFNDKRKEVATIS